MNPDPLDLRLSRFRSRRDEYPHALATALIEAGRSSEALEVVKLGLSSYADDPALLVLEGRAWFEHGDLPQAQSALLRAAKLNPRDKEPYRWLAQVMLMRGEPARATQVLERALSIDPEDRGLIQAKARAERLARLAAASSRPPPAVESLADGNAPLAARQPPLETARRAPVGDDDDEPTNAAQMSKGVRTFLERERNDVAPPPYEAPIAARAEAYAMPASESGRSLDVGSAELSDVGPRVEPPGTAESPEAVLAVLKDHGVFATDAVAGQSAWVPSAEAGRTGQRVSRSILVAWLVAAVGAGGGYYGFDRWLDARRGDARSLVSHAEELSREGDYPALLAAERELVRARSLDPKSHTALEALVFVHAARALEDASGELGYLQTSLLRAREQSADSPLVAAGEAVVFAYEGKPEDARTRASYAAEHGADDARVAYLVGRLYARAGREGAAELLASASQRDPGLALAWLAQGELALARGDGEAARALLERARGRDGVSLRAELWLLLIDAATDSVEGVTARFDALGKRVDEGSRSERLLAVAVRAELALRRADRPAARAALSGAGDLAVRDPEVMYALAERALRADEASVAYRSARAAMTLAPSVSRYRDAFVDALLMRGDGEAALETLADTDAETPEKALVRARAALLADGAQALAAAKKSLAALKPSDPEFGVTRAALLSRLDIRLGASPESLLPAARTLAQRAKEKLAPQLALAELLLAAQQAKDAVVVAQRALDLAPEDADALTLLGRAQRMAGALVEARTTLQRAVSRAPARRDAQRALGSLLLDSGDYGEARALFDKLAQTYGVLRDSLSAIEARAYSGDFAGAQALLDKLDEGERALPATRIVAARVALGQNDSAAALAALEPLLAEEGEHRSASSLTLYGDALFAAGRVDPAAGAYDEALDLDASYPEALLGRAIAALRAEKFKQTLELLDRADQALSTRARPPGVHANAVLVRARLAFAQKDFAQVRDLAASALKLPACPPEAHFWMAEALTKLKALGASEQYAEYLAGEPAGVYAARAKRALSPR